MVFTIVITEIAVPPLVKGFPHHYGSSQRYNKLYNECVPPMFRITSCLHCACVCEGEREREGDVPVPGVRAVLSSESAVQSSVTLVHVPHVQCIPFTDVSHFYTLQGH